MAVRIAFVCDRCLGGASARPGALPRGWHAHGPSPADTRYPSTRTLYFCSSNCSLAWTEHHVAECQEQEKQ